VLYGTFQAMGDGMYDKNLSIFNGRYPYYVEVEPDEEIKTLKNASRIFKKLKISWKSILSDEGAKILKLLLEGKIEEDNFPNNINLEDELFRPPIFSTTLWNYPKQSYGDTPKGNNKYPGVTPAFIIYNLLYRYTEPGDLVCDPMAGSGTTIDVCKEERRKVIAFDIVPVRKDIIQADARNLPLKDESVDLIHKKFTKNKLITK
jgi:DNA modification methylase